MAADNRPDVALFLPFPCWGGTETVFLNLARFFAGRGLEVDAVFGVADGPLLRDFESCCRVTDLGNWLMRLHRRERYAAFDFPALRSYVRERRPRSLLSAKATCNYCAARVKKELRFPDRVVITHHVDVKAGRAALGPAQRLVASWLESWYRHADAVVGVARAIADGLVESGLDPARVHAIYNPVVTDELFRHAEEPPPHPWLQQKSGPVVLGAGRFTPQKDFGNLIRAFSRVLNEVPDCRLLIVGDGPDRDKLERLVGRLSLSDRVDLPGTAANPFPYMKHADLYVLSSRYEGLGLTLVEALALGTPVVSTDCPCGPAEVLDSGRYGTLVPIEDHVALARAMADTLLHPRPTDDQVAWAKKTFSVETAGEQYLSLLLGGETDNPQITPITQNGDSRTV